MNTWGSSIRVSIFGVSHGPAIGCVLDGIMSGIKIDNDFISQEMERRAPGNSSFATSRKEADKVRILDGIKDGFTTGSPIVGLIENTDQNPSDYSDIIRPSHADWTSLLKYGTYADMSGGGRFSGRLTAPLVFAGAICKIVLKEMGIRIYGRISGIAEKTDSIDLAEESMNTNAASAEELLAHIASKEFPAADEMEDDFKSLILAAKTEGDSIGGSIETAIFGNTSGMGDPFFDSIESVLSSLFFSVPAVKAVEWGKGIMLTQLRGSEANDSLKLSSDGKTISSITNNNGGILGGIANGMSIFARVHVKPTASIAKEQKMIALGITGKDLDIVRSEVMASVQGRHDPCIVPRAVPVIEAAAAIGMLELASREKRL